MKVALATRDFHAEFYGETRESGGLEEDGIWILSGQSGGMSVQASVSWEAKKAEPFPMKVAFALPLAINRFELDCGGRNLGTVTVGAQGSAPGMNLPPASTAAPAPLASVAAPAPTPQISAPRPPVLQASASQNSQPPAPRPLQVSLGQTIAIPGSGIEIELKEVALVKGGFHGMTSVSRLANGGFGQKFDGTLGIAGRIVRGDSGAFWSLDKWLADANGQSNAKNEFPMAGLAGVAGGGGSKSDFTMVFSVPTTSRAFVLHLGNAVAIDLAPFLQFASGGASGPQPLPMTPAPQAIMTSTQPRPVPAASPATVVPAPRALATQKLLGFCEFQVDGTSKAGNAGAFVGGAAGAAIATSGTHSYYVDINQEVLQTYEKVLGKSGSFRIVNNEDLVGSDSGKQLSLSDMATRNNLLACVSAKPYWAARMGFDKQVGISTRWEVEGPGGCKLKFKTSVASSDTYGKFPNGADPALKSAYLDLSQEDARQFLETFQKEMEKSGCGK